MNIITISREFGSGGREILIEQTRIIEEIAKAGKECVRADKPETLSRKEIENNICRIDRNRTKTREMITGGRWGERRAYHLIINTTDWNIKDLTPAVAGFVSSWFRR